MHRACGTSTGPTIASLSSLVARGLPCQERPGLAVMPVRDVMHPLDAQEQTSLGQGRKHQMGLSPVWFRCDASADWPTTVTSPAGLALPLGAIPLNGSLGFFYPRR